MLDSVAALRVRDVVRFGQLMVDSHHSLRGEYAVSGPELGALVVTALETPGVLSARLTRAGFGGCVVALVAAQRAGEAAAKVSEVNRRTTGRAGATYVCTPSDGAQAPLGCVSLGGQRVMNIMVTRGAMCLRHMASHWCRAWH